MMTSRERVFSILRHEEADRLPFDFWGTAEAVDKLKQYMKKETKEEVLDALDVDLRYIEGPRYIGPKLQIEDNIEEDIWGVKRKIITTGQGEKKASYKTVIDHPLAKILTVKDAEEYGHWPNPDWYDYSVIERQCDKLRAKNRIVLFEGDRTNRIAQFKPYMYIRGMENAFMDMVLHPELFEYIVERIYEFYLEYLDRILKAANGKIDILLTGDDFGGQKNLLCSADMWRRFLEPGFKSFIEKIHEYNLIAMHHTCGCVTPIIEDFIECGLDILNPIQPDLPGMEKDRLKKKFGDRIVYHGGISIQSNLPFGTPASVRNEVKTAINMLAKNGGYIICTAHNLQADVPLENMIALFEAYKKYGTYPIACAK
jgi:uroporphyrinogen decarboxylase